MGQTDKEQSSLVLEPGGTQDMGYTNWTILKSIQAKLCIVFRRAWEANMASLVR